MPKGTWWIEANQELECLVYKGKTVKPNKKSMVETPLEGDWALIHVVKGGGMCWMALAKIPELEERACVEVATSWDTTKVNQALLKWDLQETPGEKTKMNFRKTLEDWKAEYRAAVKAGERQDEEKERAAREEEETTEIEQGLVARSVKVIPRPEKHPFGNPEDFPTVGGTKAKKQTPRKVSNPLLSQKEKFQHLPNRYKLPTRRPSCRRKRKRGRKRRPW